MTVKELLDVFPYCSEIRITIRDNGRWVQGYQIGEHLRVGMSYLRRGESPHMEEGEIRDLTEANNRLPLICMCKSVSKTPKELLRLTVDMVIPRYMRLEGNDHRLDVTCLPDGAEIAKRAVEAKRDSEHQEQISLTELM